MRTRKKNYSLTDLKKNVQELESNVKEQGKGKAKVKVLEKENDSHLNKTNSKKHLDVVGETAEKKSHNAASTAKNKTTNNNSTENNCITTRKGRRENPKTIAKPTHRNLPRKGSKLKKEVKENSILSHKASGETMKNNNDASGKRRSRNLTKQTKLATNKPKNKDDNLKEDAIIKQNNSFSNKDNETIMKSKSKRNQKQKKKTDIIKNDDIEDVEDKDMGNVGKNHIKGQESNVDIPQRNQVMDMENCSNIDKDEILANKAAERNSCISGRRSRKCEARKKEHIETTKSHNIETGEDTKVEPVKAREPSQGGDILEKNNAEIPAVSEKNYIIENDDECPEEVTFGSSREEALETLKVMKSEVIKRKKEQKEMRKRIQDRNVLQKKQKKDKADEIRKRKLPPELLEYVSKLPRISKNDEMAHSKQEKAKFMDIDKDKEEETISDEEHNSMEPSEEDFISIHGSTEFRACHLEKMIKKPKPVATSIAEFKEQMFLGNKHNKRESVWEIKSKMIKQAVAGKL